MKIVFTGGGSGGHFYPIIAVAEKIREVVKEEQLLEPELYFLAPDPYNDRLLFEQGISYRKVFAGKMRGYFSILNFFDLFKTGWGIIKSFFTVFSIFPDVVFSKGGYGAFPVLLSARILGIPVIIHESDSVPGRVNKWSSKFAEKIAISFPEAAKYFPKEKTAYTGNPIIKDLLNPTKSGAEEFLKLERNIPVLFILGGSQGSEKINNVIIEALPRLVEKYQIIHQVGKKNKIETEKIINVRLENSKHKDRYKLFGYLNTLAMRMSAGISSLVISRAGSTIHQIAAWGIPSIIIPISKSNGDHQRRNAFSYASTGAAVVMEESNISDDILIAQINEILENEEKRKRMSDAAKSYAKTDAAEKIAREIIETALRHEK